MAELRTSTARKIAAGNSSAALTAAKSNVVQQAKLMDSAGTAWHAVKYGNLEMITRLFPSQCNVYSKGPVGDNVFHIAMLLNTPSTLAIAKYLVKLYGKTLVNTPYQERMNEFDPPGQYEGETAMHIAIVNRDFDMVKFLVQNGADVRARAYGGFFQAGSAVYYGEFPLSFAACTGQKDIVSYLKRHGASANDDRDMHGNTALHMCVYHDQPDMYDHLVEYCGASEHVQNNNSQTPLLLAASIGKIAMLQHIYNKKRRVAWAYGPVTSYSLSLREIDTVQDPRGKYVPSVIETIVRKGHLDALGDPLVQTLLHNKWMRFAKRWFLTQFGAYLVWVVSQTFLVWMHCDKELWNSSARLAMEVIGVVLGVIFLAVESLDFINWLIGVHLRRKLTKATTKYRAPLYPIPGEKHDVAERKNTGFLTRLITGRTNTGQPVAEGGELRLELGMGPPAAAAASLQLHDVLPLHHYHHDLQHAHRARVASGCAGCAMPDGVDAACPAAASLGPALEEGRWWQQAAEASGQEAACAGPVALAGGAPAAAGPCAEGTSLPPGAGLGPSLPLPPQDPASAAAMLGADSGMARMQQLYAQLQAARAAGNTASLTALQQQVAALQAMRAAGGGGGGGAAATMSAATSFSNFPAATSTGTGMGLEHVDIVSVGLGPLSGAGGGPVSMLNPLAGLSSNFLAHAVSERHMGITSMLVSPSYTAAGDAGSAGGPMHSQARVSNAGPSSLVRAPSLGGSTGDGEFKNRMRGGGGDIGRDNTSTKRAEPRRKPSGLSVGAEGAEQHEGAGQDHEEAQADMAPVVLDHLRTLFHAYRGYAKRLLHDPISFVHAFHVVTTLVHFVTWAAAYGGVGGRGPRNVRVAEFDDVVVSGMALSGWLSVLYYARGFQATGQLMVLVEHGMWEVAKFICIYIFLNFGFTLAFYTIVRGTTDAVSPEGSGGGDKFDPLSNIGYGMLQLVRFLYGEADYDSLAVSPGHQVKTAFGTIYFLLYVGLVLLLLLNVLTALMVKCVRGGWGQAEKLWRLRWAVYVLRVEARMPLWLQQRFRLGEVSYDTQLQARVYNHVFEVVEEKDKEDEREAQVKALEGMLEKLRSGGSSKPSSSNPLGLKK